MRDNYPVFQDDTVNELTQGIWDSALLRWGFRKKPVGGGAEKIYLVQRSQVDKDTSTNYSILVEEARKYAFVPQTKDFPSALQAEPVANLEIYLQLQVGEFIISARIDMPTDFRSKLGTPDRAHSYR